MFEKSITSLKRYFIITIILLMIEIYSLAQSINLKTYTVREGLSNNQIRAITADSAGFLWIATWDGISRFDGYEFKNYYHIPGDTTSLPYYDIYDICVDGAGNLWASTIIGHILLYNKVTDKFEKKPELSSDITNVYENSFGVDAKGNLWIYNSARIIKRECKTGNTEEYTIKSKNNQLIKAPWPNHFYIKNADFILVPSLDSIYLFKKINASGIDEKVWILDERYTIHDDRKPIKYDYFLRPFLNITESSEGLRWLFNNNGILIMDREGVFTQFKGNLKDYNFPPISVN